MTVRVDSDCAAQLAVLCVTVCSVVCDVCFDAAVIMKVET